MASSVDMKLLRATKFPPEFNQKVDMQKVNLQVIKKWIASRISEILGSEDDVVTELCFNLVEGSRYPDIKSMQIQLTGFLDKDTAPFCKELWKLFLSAQGSPQGVPKELLEAKKAELIQEKIEAEKAAEEARNGKDAIEAFEVAVAGTIGEAATDAEAIELSRTATEASGAAEIDPFHHLAEAEVPTEATVIDTFRKIDVAVVAAVRRVGRCLPTLETQCRDLVPSLGAGVVADDQVLDQSLLLDEVSNPVDHRFSPEEFVVTCQRFRFRQQQTFASTQTTQILQLAKSITICRPGQPATTAQISVFIKLAFTQSKSSTQQARPRAHQPQSLSWPVEAPQHSQ
ncbi:PWI domain-containing protein [Apiospora saccharicola]|uniref:PWI domain-containing protein n=1 Tax=Apiospora saccharicola TaxID=335842 RepID=A0ABR1WHQ5_9PEZI